jgi:anti-sigma regulatory factor (Ser/Thr protein kinase)
MIRSLEPQRHIAVFPASLLSARQARQFVQAELVNAGADDEVLAERLALVTSELVTNAVVHAGTDIEVRITIEVHDVWVEVVDAGPNQPYRAPPSLTETSGRGLLLVDALADAWGVAEVQDGQGKMVWIRVSRAGTE